MLVNNVIIMVVLPNAAKTEDNEKEWLKIMAHETSKRLKT